MVALTVERKAPQKAPLTDECLEKKTVVSMAALRVFAMAESMAARLVATMVASKV